MSTMQATTDEKQMHLLETPVMASQPMSQFHNTQPPVLGYYANQPPIPQVQTMQQQPMQQIISVPQQTHEYFTAQQPSAEPYPTQRPIPVMERPKTVTRLSQLDEIPEYIDCPYCNKRTLTKVAHESSDTTNLAALVCCLFCGVITVCVPALCGWFADTNHTCSECGKQVTHKTHNGPVQVTHPKAMVSRQEPSKFAPVQPTEYRMERGVQAAVDVQGRPTNSAMTR